MQGGLQDEPVRVCHRGTDERETRKPAPRGKQRIPQGHGWVPKEVSDKGGGETSTPAPRGKRRIPEGHMWEPKAVSGNGGEELEKEHFLREEERLLDVTVTAAIKAGGSRQVVAAVVAAALRTLLSHQCDDEEVHGRSLMVEQSMLAHKALDQLINRSHHHHMGVVLASARSRITKNEY